MMLWDEAAKKHLPRLHARGILGTSWDARKLALRKFPQ